MQTRRWLNPSQPQTLVIAVFLLYLNAAFTVLYMLIGVPVGLDLLPAGLGFVAGLEIANERRVGYYLALVAAFLPFVMRAAFNSDHSPFRGVNPLELIFEVALVALLLHTQSREYQKVWFK